MVLFSALKQACSSAMIFSACGWSLLRIIFDISLIGLCLDGDKADGSVVLAPVQVSFLWESDNQDFSPFDWPFSGLQDLAAD